MALSQRARKALEIACPQGNATSSDGSEIADAIDSLHAVAPAADVAANSPAGAVTIAISTSGGNTYSDAAVNTAVNTALGTVVTDMNSTRTQINAILTALKNAGLMS